MPCHRLGDTRSGGGRLEVVLVVVLPEEDRAEMRAPELTSCDCPSVRLSGLCPPGLGHSVAILSVLLALCFRVAVAVAAVVLLSPLSLLLLMVMLQLPLQTNLRPGPGTEPRTPSPENRNRNGYRYRPTADPSVRSIVFDCRMRGR